MRIYLPCTINILTPGHIKVFEKLLENPEDDLFVGLLTPRALKGYKKELVPFQDRRFILESLDIPMIIVPQESLDPTENIKFFECGALASGDGFEEIELKAIKKLGLKKINIKLNGERKKKYSSTKIWQKG